MAVNPPMQSWDRQPHVVFTGMIPGSFVCFETMKPYRRASNGFA